MKFSFFFSSKKYLLFSTHVNYFCSSEIIYISKISGRAKEILITAGGENVAPIPIEETIKKQLPCVANAMLIGDRKKFLSVLLTLKTEVDPVTLEPLPELAPITLEWCSSIGSKAKVYIHL